jgi:hypothetical protein
MFASRVPCLAFLLLFVLVMSAVLVPAVAQTTPATPVASRIVTPINDAVRVTIPNSTHPMAKPAYDIGGLDGATALQRVILVLGGSSDQEWQARTLVDSQQTKGSPDYHKWLTPAQYGQKFAPSAQDIAQVTGWLQQHGFTIGSVAKSGLWIEFSGTSAQVETTFQTQMHQYLVSGELHVANATNISIPAALAPVVRGVLSLHNFYAQPMLQRSHTMGPRTVNRSHPNATDASGDHFVTPGDVANIYDLNPLYNNQTAAGTINGSGQTIALVAVGNINLADVAAFQGVFGLPANPPNIILNGPDPGIDGASDEASLDVEYSGAIAPDATIDLVVSGGTLTTDPVALSAAFIVDQNLAGVMSMSFGICEAALGTGSTLLNDGNPFWNALWEQAAAQGISASVSSGDTGAAGCDPNGGITAASQGLGVNGLGSTPFNTAVGGTEFNEGTTPTTFWNTTNAANLSSAIGYIPEKVWNDSCSPTTVGSFCQQDDIFSLASGGGGVSSTYAVPSYQTLSIEGLTGAGFPKRPVPDVSLDAANDHDPYIFCFTPPGSPQDCAVDTVNNTVSFSNFAGGTSFSSPEFAGIMALVDEAVAGRQGLANQTLYALAATESSSFSTCNSSNRTNPATGAAPACTFNDVTTGNNGVPGNDTLSGGAFVPPGDTSGQLGYNAETGYDPAIGLGSVNAALLVNAWASLAKGFLGSTTTLTTSPTTIDITHGTSVSVSVSVARQGTTGTPSGSISLLASGGNLPSNLGITSEALSGSGGTATAGPASVSNLPGGTAYNLTASFPGDGTFAGSTSNAITVTVSPENTTTTLQSFIFNETNGTFTTGTSVDYGDANNILVVDADSVGSSGLLPASGIDTFNFNTLATQIGIDNSGIGEIADCFLPLTACLAPGTYTVSASYSGDGLSYNGSSTAASITITITPGIDTPAVQAPPVVGINDSFTLGAVIGTGLGTIVPTGTVQFQNNGTNLGNPVTLSAGQASMPATFSAATNSVTVQYSGDGNYKAENSQAFVVTAVQTPFSFAAITSSQTITPGQNATYSLTLNGNSGFSGQVSFNCTGAPSGATCAVAPNPATLSASATSVPVTVVVSNTSNARLAPHPFRSLPFVFAGLLGLVVAGARRKPKHRLLMLMLLGVLLVVGVCSCGGGGGGGVTATPQNFTLTLTGTSGSITSTTTLTLTVN